LTDGSAWQAFAFCIVFDGGIQQAQLQPDSMNYYAILNKWSYTLLALLVYVGNVLIQAHFRGGLVTPNYYFEAGLFLFLAYLVAVDFFIPFLTGNSTLNLASSWRNAMRASLIENTLAYLVLFGFLLMTRDLTVSRMVVGVSFLSSVLVLTIAHCVIPRFFYDLSNQDSELPRRIRKSVIIWGVNYHPEPTGIGPQTTHLAETLAGMGYEVTVVTAFSYYPAWMKDSRDEGRLFRRDEIKGVSIRRCWLYVPDQPNFIKRVAQQLSFVMSSTLQLMFMESPSFYIGVCPPFLVGPVLRLLSKIKKAPYAVHLQDDEIGAAYETAGLSVLAHDRLRIVEHFGFRGAKVLSTISPLMKERIEQRLERHHIKADVLILSNKAHASGKWDLSKARELRASFPCRRLLLYSGNLGDKQVLDDVVEAVARYPKEQLMLVICGDGAQRKRLAKLVESKGCDNIRFQSLLSDDDHECYLAAADVCILSEKTQRGKWLSPGICFASKLLSYFKHAKPVLVYAGNESEVLGIVREYGCGFFLREAGLDALLQECVDAESEELSAMGIAGHVYYESFLSKYKPMTWIALMERKIAERKRIEASQASLMGKVGTGFGEVLLRVVSIPLAVVLYGILALPIKVGSRDRRSHQDAERDRSDKRGKVSD
jgi:colanic acid biosynthesis glycosyl transferase WcaI